MLKPLLLVILSYLFIATGFASERLLADIKMDYPYLKSLYEDLHKNPELSLQEQQTMQRIAGELRSLDFTVTENIGGFGFVAVLKNGPGPTLLIRTDLDALPIVEDTGLAYASTKTVLNGNGQSVGVMHACGHDIHMTVFTGTARRLVNMKQQWQGTLVMIGQPAEEVGKGAKAMLADGLFRKFPKPDANLALHVYPNLPAGSLGYASGYAMASVDSVDITVHGVSGHGAYPHLTVDPIVIAARIVTALQTLVSRETSPTDAAVVTVGSFHAGTKRNVISDNAKLQLTVRSYKPEVRKRLLDGIKRIARAQGISAGLAENKLPEVSYGESYTPALYNNPELVQRVVTMFIDRFGEDRVAKVDPVMGGEDFSRYGSTEANIPSFMFRLGVMSPDYLRAAANDEVEPIGLHSKRLAPIAQPSISTGVEAMTRAAMLLLQPQ